LLLLAAILCTSRFIVLLGRWSWPFSHGQNEKRRKKKEAQLVCTGFVYDKVNFLSASERKELTVLCILEA